MYHFFNAITNTSGDSLIGYFGRVIDMSTQGAVDIFADESGTPISVVSGVPNMATTDNAGNMDFYVAPGSYHLDIYSSDATTFIRRVKNVAMNSTKGDKGDQGDPGLSGPSNNTRLTLADLKAAATTDKTSLYDGSLWTWTPGDFTGQADDINIVKANSTPLTIGAWVRQESAAITFQQAAPTAITRTVQDKLRESASPEDFGAVAGNFSIDNTVALNNWLAAAAAGKSVRLPRRRYYFKDALACVASDIEIEGRGELIYNGAATSIDLLTIGSALSPTVRLRLQGLRIGSDTVMTSGTALRLNNVYRSTIRDLVLDGQDGNGNLWNGLWFNGCDVNILDGFQISAAGDGLRCNDGSDLFLDNGKISPADIVIGTARNPACGLRIGGGFGGTQVGAVDIIGCNTNMILDNSLSVAPNREVTFSSVAALDSSAAGPNLYLNETSGAPIYIASNGWIASAATHNISIASSASAYHLIFAGGRIYNAQGGDGLHNNAANSAIALTGVELLNNSGFGVNNPTSASVTTLGCRFNGNVLGDVSGVVMDPLEPTVAYIAGGGNAAFAGSGGCITVTAADVGGSTASYIFGAGGCALVGGVGSLWVASTTTPAAGKMSVAYSGTDYRIYNNSGSAVRVQAVTTRTV